MKLYMNGLIMLIKRFIFKVNSGEALLWFASSMGVVYIKFAQILSMYNFGDLFTEEERLSLSKICDNIKPVSFSKMKKEIEKEYACPLEQKFKKVFEEPVGSASISQVYKGILKNGDVVAIKVKRKDVARKMNKDFKAIKKFVHRFGKLFQLKNLSGADYSLLLLEDWIKTETDFANEKNNILAYQEFANSVNGKVENAKNIVVPKVYKKLCTDSIIVMEFIYSKTINQMKLTDKNKEKIRTALNDYINLSFYALFHYRDVTFHGDPHGGNIYIDKEGNIGFLDMGLIFHFKDKEADFIRNLFLYSYFAKGDELTNLLLSTCKYTSLDEDLLREDIKECCLEFKHIPVTNYFINMVMVFAKYDINPPTLLFKLAKAFVDLNGINNFSDNGINTEELCLNHITEYYVNRTMGDLKDIVSTSSKILPNFVEDTLKYGVLKGVSAQVGQLFLLNKKVHEASNHFDEVLSLFDQL